MPFIQIVGKHYLEMNRSINIYVITALLSGLYSCSPGTYIQNAVNVPLLDDKNELQVTAYLNPGRVEVQTAYSINSNLAVMANGYTAFKETHTMEGGIYNADLYDLGIGYRTDIGRQSLMEIFIGAGEGWSQGNLERNWGGQWNVEYLEYSTDFNKYFFQINYAYVLPNWKLGAALRSSMVHFDTYEYAIRSNNYTYQGDIVFTDTISQKNLSGYVVDPIINLQWEKKRFKVVTQVGYSMSFFDVNHNYEVHVSGLHGLNNYVTQPRYQRIILNVGFKFTFGGKNSKHYADPIPE